MCETSPDSKSFRVPPRLGNITARIHPSGVNLKGLPLKDAPLGGCAGN
jgi:hypothetical protein